MEHNRERMGAAELVPAFSGQHRRVGAPSPDRSLLAELLILCARIGFNP